MFNYNYIAHQLENKDLFPFYFPKGLFYAKDIDSSDKNNAATIFQVQN